MFLLLLPLLFLLAVHLVVIVFWSFFQHFSKSCSLHGKCANYRYTICIVKDKQLSRFRQKYTHRCENRIWQIIDWKVLRNEYISSNTRTEAEGSRKNERKKTGEKSTGKGELVAENEISNWCHCDKICAKYQPILTMETEFQDVDSNPFCVCCLWTLFRKLIHRCV